MVRLGMWFLAAVFLACGLLLVLFLLRSRLDLPGSGIWTPGGILQITGVVLSVAAVVIALGALQVALTSSRQTQETNRNEQVGRQESETASGGNAALPPRQRLESNLSIPQGQPEVVPETHQLLEPPAGKPELELFYEGANVKDLPAVFQVPRKPNAIRLSFRVRDNGNAAAQKGTLVVIADPPTIVINRPGYSLKERQGNHRFQTAIPDVLPHSADPDDFALDLELRGNIPDQFTLSFSIFGENFEAVRRKIAFRCVP